MDAGAGQAKDTNQPDSVQQNRRFYDVSAEDSSLASGHGSSYPSLITLHSSLSTTP